MTEPWTPENEVSADLARVLIEAQFPDLAPCRVEPLGVGWDNTALRVNDELVFRFPRREIAVLLIETETHVLPAIAPLVTLPVPVPLYAGRGDPRFPWPFAGYRMLPGETACAAALDEEGRGRTAAPLARFLASLHAVPSKLAREHGATPDRFGRLDLAQRIPQVEERLARAVDAGLVPSPQPWHHVIADTPRGRRPDATLVHGDFYVRHFLVDDDRLPCGVIDWGDVHVGDPALDLSIAHGFLPPSAHAAFRAAYGPIDDETWRIARFRALQSALMILTYGHDVGDASLVREGLRALEHLERTG